MALPKEGPANTLHKIERLLTTMPPMLTPGFYSECVEPKDRTDALEMMHVLMELKWSMTQRQLTRAITCANMGIRSYKINSGYIQQWIACQDKLLLCKEVTIN